MKVILTSDLDRIGDLGDVLEVKSGFARNYLFPKQYAIPVTPHNLSVMESRRKKHEKKLAIERLSAEEQKKKIEALTLTFTKKSGENDVLFGSVTTTEIEEKLGEAGVTIERKRIHLAEPIKRIGQYTCVLKLFRDVEAEVKIVVDKEGEEAAPEV
ncbi:MAG TPA: 50S ribosomal protein L9 [Candidatus Aminicenantes bacterium]|nr:50S ribosomal protein L9 [Candidatus Aminicenantes bacterium]